MGIASLDKLDQRVIGVLERLPGAPGIARWVLSLPAPLIEAIYWLTALLSLVPALRAGLLFPHRWLDGIEVNYAFGWIENPLGPVTILCLIIVVVCTLATRKALRLLPVVPFLAVLVAGEPGTMLAGFNSVYIISALAVFLYFVAVGKLFSRYFAAFVAVLFTWQVFDDLLSWHQIIQLLIVTTILALLREIFVQNWSLLRQLGRQNLASLCGRTLLLWWPTLILIGFGLSVGWLISSSTEKLLYQFTLVEPHCGFVDAPSSGLIVCLDEDQATISKEDITALDEQQSFQLSVDSFYNEVSMEIETYFENQDVSVWATQQSAAPAIDEIVTLLKESSLNVLATRINPKTREIWSLNAPARKITAEYGDNSVDPEVIADYAHEHFHEVTEVLRNNIQIRRLQERLRGAFGGRRGGRRELEWPKEIKKLLLTFCELKDGQTFPCPTNFADADNFLLTRVGFRPSLTASVDKEFIAQQQNIDQRLRKADAALLASKSGAYGAALDVYQAVPPSLGFKKMECGELELKCRLVRLVKTELDNAYGKARDAIGVEFAESMQARANSGALQAHNAIAVTRAKLNGALEDWRWRTKASIERAYIAANVLDLLMYFWLALMAIKSLLYVFARVIFDRKTDIALDLVEETEATAQGTINFVEELVIPGNYPHDMYYKSRYQPLGPAPRFSIPQWRTSIGSRILSGSYNMAKVDMPLEDDAGLTFNATEAQHLVDWQLEEGEEVIFNYRNFVGMNENIQLRTIISLRVATLLTGRYVFHTAKCVGGPGRLILRTRGRPATPEQLDQSIPIARLVAWSRYARFSVDSHLTTQDVFLNGFNLRRDADPKTNEKGNLVVEADAREGGLLVGTLRFAKHFVLPI